MDAGRDPPRDPDEETTTTREPMPEEPRRPDLRPPEPPDDGMDVRLYRALFGMAPPPKARPLVAGRYEILVSLGQGSMGEVVRARDVKNGDTVAIKLLRRCDGNGTAADRLRREAQLIARLRHSHIVEVFEYGDLPDGRKYIVMELVEGTSLKRALEPGRPVPWRRAQAMLVQIADALAYAHDNAVVHRDLSPANILLTPRDDDSVHCTVIDFGLARSIDGAVTKELTNTGDLLGTPRYMSPEQAKGDVATPASDIYALGCIAYELLTGMPAAPGETLTEVVTMQQLHVPPPFAEVAPGLDVPPALEAAVHRALRKRPVQRFADMAAFRDALATCAEDPAPWSSRWMSFALRRLFALLLLLSVSSTIIAFAHG